MSPEEVDYFVPVNVLDFFSYLDQNFLHLLEASVQ